MSLDRRILSACIALFEERFDDVHNLLDEIGSNFADKSITTLIRWLEVCSYPDLHLRVDQLRHLKQSLAPDDPYDSLVERSLNLALEKQKLEPRNKTFSLNRTLAKIRSGKVF